MTEPRVEAKRHDQGSEEDLELSKDTLADLDAPDNEAEQVGGGARDASRCTLRESTC